MTRLADVPTVPLHSGQRTGAAKPKGIGLPNRWNTIKRLLPTFTKGLRVDDECPKTGMTPAY